MAHQPPFRLYKDNPTFIVGGFLRDHQMVCAGDAAERICNILNEATLHSNQLRTSRGDVIRLGGNKRPSVYHIDRLIQFLFQERARMAMEQRAKSSSGADRIEVYTETGTLKAVAIAHWPGGDSPMCPTHLRQAAGVAKTMGFELHSTPILHPPYPDCANCFNARKNAEEDSDG